MSTTQISMTMENGCDLTLHIEEAPELSFSIPDPVFLEFDVGTITHGGVEEYTGEYVSIPCSTVQVYDTDNKRMVEDFTVREIPVYRADNEDGVTVTIAES